MKRPLLTASSFAAILAFLASCGDEIMGTEAPPPPPEAEKAASDDTNFVQLTSDEMTVLSTMGGQSAKISQDEAISIASKLLGRETSLSKSAGAVRCEVLTRPSSRISKSGTSEADTMMYLLNFGNNDGYALVCADVRVPDQILAYSDTGEMDSQTDNPGVQMFMEMAQDYMDYHIAEVESKRDSLEEVIQGKLTELSPVKTEVIERSEGTSLSKNKIEKFQCTVMESETIKSVHKVDSLLKTQWHQGSPFNNKCNGDAGCGPIAVGQILAFWRWPMINNNYRFDWYLILNGDQNSSYYKDQVSTLVSMLRKYLDTDGTSTREHKPLKYFRSINFSTQSQMYDYQYNKVAQALNNGMPVFIRGNKNSNNGDGHMWVADGYIEQTITKEQIVKYMFIETQDNGQVVRYWYEDLPNSTSTGYSLLHFNWGWGGSGNGYYSNNVFDTNYQRILVGDGLKTQVANTNKRHYYNKNIEIIADIKPR